MSSSSAGQGSARPEAVPDPAQRLSSYLIVRDAAAAIDWYVRILGGKHVFRLTAPDGTVGHAELLFGGTTLMLADEHPDFGARSPFAIGGTPVRLHLYVADVDAVVAAASDAGATLLRAAKDEFYGDRSAMIVDPFGHQWHLSSRVEDVAPEDMQRRWSAIMSQAQ